MATPVPDSYSAASGASIFGGRVAAVFGMVGDVIALGDSLSDVGYPHAAFRLALPLTLRSPRMIEDDSGFGHTIAMLADRLQAVIDSHPTLVAVMIRIGTNGPGASSTYQIQYGRILDMLEAAGIFAIMHAVPPRGAGTGIAPFALQNAWLQEQCEAKPTKRRFINDSLRMGDANYWPLPGMFSDGIHNTALGVQTQAEDMAPLIKPLFADIDPRPTNPSDVYSINPASNQYVTNGFMVGSGPFPSGWSGSAYGGSTTGSSQIIAADPGDPNQTPWMRITFLTGGGSSYAYSVVTTLAHPAIAADTSAIKRFDVVAEMRLQNLDCTLVSYLSMTIMHANGTTVSNERIGFGSNGGIRNERMVMRSATPRKSPLLVHAANSIKLSIGLSYTGAFASSIGSVDIRCVSVRGSST